MNLKPIGVNPKSIKVLGIESSCDETAAAVVVNGRQVLSNVISSQIDLHKKYGGVVPEIASRKHIENISYVIDEALEQAGLSLSEIDVVGVTSGPGLVGALLVGISTAKALAYALSKPLVGVNHITGHIAANYLGNEDFKPPFLCLVVSGGHTNIIQVKDYTEYQIIGKTLDDAIGEAFDKVARAIGLGYPGGPKIDRIAGEGDENRIAFPKANVEGYNFSFSGVKSAVLNYINSQRMKEQDIIVADVAACFQKAVVEAVVEKTIQAAKDLGITQISIAGGVAANSYLRAKMATACQENGFELKLPPLIYCTDNAAMIAGIAYYEYQAGKIDGLDLNAIPNLKL